jgi:hypothetical protein
MPYNVEQDPAEFKPTLRNTFGTTARIITPGASDITPYPKGVVCLTAGNITIVPAENADGVTLAFVGVPAGYIPPYRVRRVTAATAIVATIED